MKQLEAKTIPPMPLLLCLCVCVRWKRGSLIKWKERGREEGARERGKFVLFNIPKLDLWIKYTELVSIELCLPLSQSHHPRTFLCASDKIIKWLHFEYLNCDRSNAKIVNYFIPIQKWAPQDGTILTFDCFCLIMQKKIHEISKYLRLNIPSNKFWLTLRDHFFRIMIELSIPRIG